MPEVNHPLALDPTWTVAFVVTVFVVVSMLVERGIHRLSSWLWKTNRKALYETVEKMKEELMLLGFISLLLTASSKTISSICINEKFYVGNFAPCTKSEAEKTETKIVSHRNLKKLMHLVSHSSVRRQLEGEFEYTCKKGYEPFVSYEGLEQLHRFIFIMAITHVAYSCLTMLLAIVKIHSWRSWEDEAHRNRHEAFTEIARELQLRRQAMLVKFHASNPLGGNKFLGWLTCFFQQFGQSVDRVNYLALRMGFIMNHNLTSKFDFHSYMVRSMEEEFRRIVGVSAKLWGFVVAFMLFDIKGTNLYFWVAIIPLALVLVLGTKLQHIIATLAWENAGITGFFAGTRLKPRDDLFWFKKPQLVLSLIHFVLFQNSFELASFFWFWWQFGYESCFISNHLLVYLRLIMGFVGQLLCSYSTLPLYALVTQMGTNYKAALIPERIRETLQGLTKETKRKRRSSVFKEMSFARRSRVFKDISLARTGKRVSVEDDEDDEEHYNNRGNVPCSGTELPTLTIRTVPSNDENSERMGAGPLRAYNSVPAATSRRHQEEILRSSSFPLRRV